MTRLYDPASGQWVESGSGTSTSMRSRTETPAGTVEGRLKGLLTTPNPLMNSARKSGQAFAAGRGLLNSTLGAQAGEQAFIQSALPIAQQDAAARNQMDSENMQAANAWAMMESQRAPQGERGGLSVVGIDSSSADREERAWRSQEAAADRAFQREMTTGDREFRRREGETDREFQQRMAELGQNFSREMTLGDREFRRREGETDREFQQRILGENRSYDREQRDLDRQFQRSSMDSEARYSMFGNFLSQAFGTVFSSPDFFRDPAAANGFLEFFSTSFGSLFDSVFGRQRPTGG